MYTHALLLTLGLLLALPRCTRWAPAAAPEQAARAALLVPAPQPAVDSVGLLLGAWLDTTRGGSRTVDTRLRLQIGPEVRALYGLAPAPLWTTGPDSLSVPAQALLALLTQLPAYGLRPPDYDVPQLLLVRDSLQRGCYPGKAARRARFDLQLSDAVLTCMRDLHRGRLRPYTWSPRERAAKQAFHPAEALRRGLAAGQVAAAVRASQPANREYRQLQAALAQWLRQPSAPDSGAQRRAQYEQVALNLERWRWEAIVDSAYVLVNLPACELQVVDRDSVPQRHRVIIGKAGTPTPTLSSRITHFTLAPDWYVPASIATREILPRLRTDPGYLARHNYALYSRQGQPLDPYLVNWNAVSAAAFPYFIRQSAGCDNALGNVVFRFPNPYAVYLHDTPTRQLFAQPQRALSHGCVRVQHPLALAAYLLRRDGQAVALPDEQACARQPRPQDVRLRRPLPLHVRYATCAVEGGQLRFYPDVYRRDARLRQALAGGPMAQ